jgi:hypothetical protein
MLNIQKNKRAKEIFYVPGGTKIMDFEAPLSYMKNHFLISTFLVQPMKL